MDAFFDKVIEEHRDPNRPEPDQEDIIDVLLRIQKDPNQEFKLKEEHVKGVLGVCIPSLKIFHSIL